MGLFSKRKSKEEQLKELEKTALYILMDNPKMGFVQYMKEQGIEITNIFYNILEASYAFMVEDRRARIVIIDTGMGQFNKVSNRDEIISLLGMCTDGKNGVVFYSDSSLKTSVTKSMPRIPVYKYVSTLEIINTLRSFNEDYCYSGTDLDSEDTVTGGLLQYKGKEIEKFNNENNVTLKATSLLGNIVGNEEDTIPVFNVKY